MAQRSVDSADQQHPRPVESPIRWLLRQMVYFGVLLVVGFVLYSGVEGLLQANSLDSRMAETRAELAELQQDADQLAALVAWLDSDAFIERVAREDLGMVRAGEEAFGIRAPRRNLLAIDRSPWWKNLLPHEDPGAVQPIAEPITEPATEP